MNSCASSHRLTFSTGLSGPRNWLGFAPLTASHWACVTSYLPMSKGLVIATRCAGDSLARHDVSPGEHPMMNSPAGILTNSPARSTELGGAMMRFVVSAPPMVIDLETRTAE